MKGLTRKTLLRNIQEQIAIMKRLDPKDCDPDEFERTLKKAKAVIYGSKEANGVIKDEQLEDQDERITELEKRLEDE